MTSYQRQEFITGLTRNKIDHKIANGGEIAIFCPLCGPQHDNRRRTLSINSQNDRWHCFRCPEFKGRKKQIPKLLKALNLEHLVPVFDEDEVLIEDDSLVKLKHKLLFGEEEQERLEAEGLKLPEGTRYDWDTTIIGRNLYRYLTLERKLSTVQIEYYEMGYCIAGKYSGCIVLPVYMNRMLRFWQVRYVAFTGPNNSKYDSPRGVERANVLFDYDSVRPGDSVIVVEGIFDKLAVGGSCVALLGKTISDQQISLLAAKGIESVVVMLDGEAWKDCQQVAYEVRKKLWGVRLVTAIRLPFGKDPGIMGRSALQNPLQTLRLKA